MSYWGAVVVSCTLHLTLYLIVGTHTCVKVHSADVQSLVITTVHHKWVIPVYCRVLFTVGTHMLWSCFLVALISMETVSCLIPAGLSLGYVKFADTIPSGYIDLQCGERDLLQNAVK